MKSLHYAVTSGSTHGREGAGRGDRGCGPGGEPLTSVASVVEMTGDYPLTLPPTSAAGHGNPDTIGDGLTSASVRHAVAARIGGTPPEGSRPATPATSTVTAAVGREPAPPILLDGHRVIQLAAGESSPATGSKLGQVSWPVGTVPVSVLRDRRVKDPDPNLRLAPGDRTSLLTLPPDASESEPDGGAARIPERGEG
jgi:hypothetical protein